MQDLRLNGSYDIYILHHISMLIPTQKQLQIRTNHPLRYLNANTIRRRPNSQATEIILETIACALAFFHKSGNCNDEILATGHRIFTGPIIFTKNLFKF